MMKRSLLLAALLGVTLLAACNIQAPSTSSKESSQSFVSSSRQSEPSESNENEQNSTVSSSEMPQNSSQGSSQNEQSSEKESSKVEDGSMDSSESEESCEDSATQSSESSSAKESESSEEEQTGFTVTFDTAGGTKIASQKVEEGQKVIRPDDPTKTDSKCDYVFAGWYVGDYEWNFETDIVTDDITLTAKWEVDGEYTNPFLPSD